MFTRRNVLKGTGATMLAMAAHKGRHDLLDSAQEAQAGAAPLPGDTNRAERMKWWKAARFGMFIHIGVYSTIGRHEWVMEDEAIPVSEYAPQAATFHPREGSPRAWARLARQAGMKYMVMTSKHHEGFCNFDTRLTNYCARKQGPGRDLAREYVEAARAEGMRVGFYYSLMDWHRPDGALCATNEDARNEGGHAEEAPRPHVSRRDARAGHSRLRARVRESGHY
jgi:alpha-L-fucosidase